MGSGAFFPNGIFFFWWDLKPRPWAGPNQNTGLYNQVTLRNLFLMNQRI